MTSRNREVIFKKHDPKVVQIVRICYPNWYGRSPIKVQVRAEYQMRDYWDGGSRNYVEFFHLPYQLKIPFSQVEYEHQHENNPYKFTMGKAKLTKEIAAVENVIFQGRDLGVRIYVHPEVFDEFTQ